MSSHIRPIVKKEFRQISRDRGTLGVLIFLPAFMLVMFGYALTFDIKHTSLAILDEDKSVLSRSFADKFTTSEYFDRKFTLEARSDIDALIDREKVRAAVVIPRGFASKLTAGRDARIQVIVDGANSNSASIASGYIEAIVMEFSTSISLDILSKKIRVTIAPPIALSQRIWYNPELKSVRVLIPGLMAFILMVTAVISTALSIVREKERGTIEQVIVSPIKPYELIIGKTIPYLVISSISAVVILIAGYYLFDVGIVGSYSILFVATLVYIFGALGFGLLISSLVETQQTAFMISTFATMLPTFILSGFIFPIKNMPAVIQAITYIIPARYYIVVLKGVMMKGIGVNELYPQIIFLTAFATLVTGMAIVRIKKKGF